MDIYLRFQLILYSIYTACSLLACFGFVAIFLLRERARFHLMMAAFFLSQACSLALVTLVSGNNITFEQFYPLILYFRMANIVLLVVCIICQACRIFFGTYTGWLGWLKFWRHC